MSHTRTSSGQLRRALESRAPQRRDRLQPDARRSIIRLTRPILAPSRSQLRSTRGCFRRPPAIPRGWHQLSRPPRQLSSNLAPTRITGRRRPPRNPKRPHRPGIPKALLSARALGGRGRRTFNPRLVDGYRIRRARVPPRRRSRNPRLERRLPPLTLRQVRHRQLPRPQQRQGPNLPTRAEHKPQSRETRRDFRGELAGSACTPIGSTLTPSGKRPPDDRPPSTPIGPSGASGPADQGPTRTGAELNTLVTPFHLKEPTGAKDFYNVQRTRKARGRKSTGHPVSNGRINPEDLHQPTKVVGALLQKTGS